MGNDLYGFSPGCDPTEIAKATMTGLFRELQGIHFGKERLNKMDKRDLSFLDGSIGAAPTEHICAQWMSGSVGHTPTTCMLLPKRTNSVYSVAQKEQQQSSRHPGTFKSG